MAGPCLEDTCSVTLTSPGNKLAADVNLRAAGGLSCTPGQGIGINLGSDGCGIDLSINGAGQLEGDLDLNPNGGLICGPAGVGIRLDPNACNGLTLGGAGLRYNEHTSRLLTGAGGNPSNGTAGVTITALGVSINPDVFAATYGAQVREITGRTPLSYMNDTCRTVNFKATWASGPIGLSLVNGWWFGVGTRNEIISPNATGTASPSVQYNTAAGPFVGTGSSLGLVYPPAAYSIESFLLPGQSVQLFVSLIAQALIGGPASTNGLNPNSASIFFGQALALDVWTR